MADVTFAGALAALRAECGEPTWSHDHDTARMEKWGERVWIVGERNGDVYVWAGRTRWLATDEPTMIALTPLADAVRDAGAWLRGRR